MIQKCKELTAYDAQYRIPWIVFDRDQVRNFYGVGKVTLRRAIHLSGTDNSEKMYCDLTYKMLKWMPERWCSLWQLKAPM